MIENGTWYNGQYIDIIAVQCTLPNNFQMCMAFDNGLCFSGCGTCTPGNAQQLTAVSMNRHVQQELENRIIKSETSHNRGTLSEIA